MFISIPFGCTKWRHVTCVCLYTDGASLHRIGACFKCRCCHFLTTTCVSFVFFPLKLLTEAADMSLWVLVPSITAFPAKNSSDACPACSFGESKHRWYDLEPICARCGSSLTNFALKAPSSLPRVIWSYPL